MNKKSALLFTFLIFFLNIFFVFLFTDKPFLTANYRQTNNPIAAIAIRDNVSDFEKAGSYLFTNARLENCYKQVMYITLEQYWYSNRNLSFEIQNFFNRNKVVDIFLLAHGNDMVMLFEKLQPKEKEKIRMVYNTGCDNAQQYDLWFHLVAKTYISHPAKKSLSPIFYFYFLRRWCNGYALEKAVAEANIKQNKDTRLLSFLGFDLLVYDSKAQLYGNSKLMIHNEK